MAHLVSADDRAAFKRCRRQWDFSATIRRSLQPRRPLGLDLDRAVRDALNVYYFPGMWDWDSTAVLPLVLRALDVSLARQCGALEDGLPSPAVAESEAARLLEQGRQLLQRYFARAPTVDRFSPVRVATDFDVLVPDPADPDSGLVAPAGGEIRYTGRVDLLAIDEHDRYWIVRHRVTDRQLPPTDLLLLDEESVAACWAWERFYDGMQVAGTIHNELTVAAAAAGTRRTASMSLTDHPRGGVPQNEPSGGGRGVSSLRRMYVRGRAAETTDRVHQTEAAGFRRTVVRRGRAEILATGEGVAEEALEMVGGHTGTPPSPAPEACSQCAFVAPCLALHEGRDHEPMLASSYRRRPAVALEIGRLGGSPDGVGRGWGQNPWGQRPTNLPHPSHG